MLCLMRASSAREIVTPAIVYGVSLQFHFRFGSVVFEEVVPFSID